MKNFHQILALFTGAALTLGLISCGNNTGTDKIDFDRPAMLQNYGNNIILPSYEKLQNAVNDLQSSAGNFAEETTEEHLVILQSDLKKARLVWQEANLFQFGPAESTFLRTSLNTYPADTDKIDENISTGDYTFGTLANNGAEGLPALDYLLHGTGENNQEIVSQYTDDSNADTRTSYLLDNITFIKEKTDATVTGWRSDGGNYLDTFLSDDKAGTDDGSSISMMVNAAVPLHYERFLRDGKIGIPAGVSSAGVPRPTATEAHYGGYSLELAIANLEAVQRYFEGRTLNDSDGLGLDDHLNALPGGEELSETIKTELNEAKSALEALNDPLSQQIEENNDPVLSAFQELQDLVPLLKADMTSVLGIRITVADTDGD